MNTPTASPSQATRPRFGADHGAAVIVLLYALSVFSVLALTVLRNTGLERRLRTGEDPDLHVVLYADGAGSERVVGRLNLPTTERAQEGEKDRSVETQAPGPVGLSLMAEFPEEAAYAIQLTPGLRVCCDVGNACSSAPWDQVVPEGTVAPPITRPLSTTDGRHQLQFELSAFSVPVNAPVDPDAAVRSTFMLRATRVAEGGSAAEFPGASSEVACSLNTPEVALARGKLRLVPGVDEQGNVTRVSGGAFELSYVGPK